MLADFAVTRDSILQHAHNLPAAPQVLGGLCELLQDVNTDLDRIADEIRVDSALAARVIRLSNSVMFGGGATVASIEEAVNRIGFSEIVRLVGVATVSGLVDRTLEAYGVAANRFRESLLLHALASEALARWTELDSRSAYAAGLLRGVGLMVLDRVSRDRISYDPDMFANYGDWEQACFNVRSATVTTMILDEWRFPAESVAALEQHLAPTGDRFAAVLHLAGAIVAQQDLALPGERTCWRVTPQTLALAGLSESDWEDAATQSAALFARQKGTLY